MMSFQKLTPKQKLKWLLAGFAEMDEAAIRQSMEYLSGEDLEVLQTWAEENESRVAGCFIGGFIAAEAARREEVAA